MDLTLGRIKVGVGLCSTTVFDIFEDESMFLHEISSLGALQYGGYDTTKNFWWNNA